MREELILKATLFTAHTSTVCANTCTQQHAVNMAVIEKNKSANDRALRPTDKLTGAVDPKRKQLYNTMTRWLITGVLIKRN